MQILAIVPARYASTRFPGKPLVQLGGKSMLQRVTEQLKKTQVIDHVIVATDDKRIADHAESFAQVVMTSPDHPSGTDRCAEVLAGLGSKFDIVINVQGDEPFIQPNQLEYLVNAFNDKGTQIATLIKPITDHIELFNPNIVKVVREQGGKALYFSRQPIPFIRGKEQSEWVHSHMYYKHLGVYGYRSGILPELTRLEVSSLEKAESLEQLRWIENGYTISTVITSFQSLAVDTPEDVDNVEKFLREHPQYL